MTKKSAGVSEVASVKNPARTDLAFRVTYITLFSLLTISYILLSFLPSPLKTALKMYNLTPSSYRLLILPIISLVVISWIAGLYGALTFRSYSRLIGGTKDGEAIRMISIGLLILVIVQPLGANIAAIAGLIDRSHVNLVPTLTIMTNYTTILLTALYAGTIAIGAERLIKLLKGKVKAWPQSVWVAAFIIASSLYSYFIVIEPIHTPLARRIYFLPNWLLLVSVAIPYLLIWYIGLSAVYKIYLYNRNVRGWVYKNALNYLAAGIALVIATSIITRVLTTVSNKLSQLSLTPVLFVIYGLLLINALGFVLIAFSAKDLRKIEEV